MTPIRLVATADIWPHLLPNLLQIEQLAALIVVAAGFILIGASLRVLTGRSELPSQGLVSADLVVGWGAVVGLFVMVGSFTDVAFTHVAVLVGVWAVVGGAWAWRQGALATHGVWLKILVLLIPLLAVTATLTPSENDDFSQWLPNLRYLLLVDHFPGPHWPASDSVFPAYPYATALVGYLVSLMTGQLSATAVDHFNVLLLGGLGLLINDQWESSEPRKSGWRRLGFALALATLLCPSFVARLVLSNYVDCATSITLAFAAVLTWRLVASQTAPKSGDIIQAAVAMAILILAKQANLVLLAACLGGIGIACLPHLGRLVRLAIPLGCAAIAYLAWRHVVQGIGGGEMPMAPFAHWQWGVLPETLSNMGKVMINKSGYFALALVLVGFAVPLRRSNPMVMVFAATFLGFTFFLTWVYLAVYIGYEGRSAASFWRYHTQLGGLQMVAAAALLGHFRTRLLTWVSPRFSAWGGGFLVVVLCIGPVLGAKHVRFDINPSKDHVRQAVLSMGDLVPKGSRLLVADPDGNGFFNNFVRWYLGFQAPYADGVSVFTPPGSLAQTIANEKITHIYAISASPELEAVLGQAIPTGGTSLFVRNEEGGWTDAKFWPFQGFSRIDAYKY